MLCQDVIHLDVPRAASGLVSELSERMLGDLGQSDIQALLGTVKPHLKPYDQQFISLKNQLARIKKYVVFRRYLQKLNKVRGDKTALAAEAKSLAEKLLKEDLEPFSNYIKNVGANLSFVPLRVLAAIIVCGGVVHINPYAYMLVCPPVLIHALPPNIYTYIYLPSEASCRALQQGARGPGG